MRLNSNYSIENNKFVDETNNFLDHVFGQCNFNVWQGSRNTVVAKKMAFIANVKNLILVEYIPRKRWLSLESKRL